MLMEPNWWPAGFSCTLVGGTKAVVSILEFLEQQVLLSPSANSVSTPMAAQAFVYQKHLSLSLPPSLATL